MSHIYPQDFKYGVINTVDLANVDFDETIYPTSPTSLRYSLDDSQFLINGTSITRHTSLRTETLSLHQY